MQEDYYEELLKEFRGCFYELLKNFSEEDDGEHPSFGIYLLVTNEVLEEIVLNYRR